MHASSIAHNRGGAVHAGSCHAGSNSATYSLQAACLLQQLQLQLPQLLADDVLNCQGLQAILSTGLACTRLPGPAGQTEYRANSACMGCTMPYGMHGAAVPQGCTLSQRAQWHYAQSGQ